MVARRTFLTMTAALPVAGAVGAVASDAPEAPLDDDPDLPGYLRHGGRRSHGALGANFNQNLDSVVLAELDFARAFWVRGFLPMTAVTEIDPGEHFAVQTILSLARRGHGTVFSLKFPYANRSFPEPGSAEMEVELSRVDAVLSHVINEVDILTIGNEPFIESLAEERDERLNDFYETVAQRVIDFRREHGSSEQRTSLYMGALNRLDLADRHTPAAERWMTFIRETPELEGVDIHPHVEHPDAVQPFLDYILPRMRADQTFLVTEFSLVWHWKAHLRNAIDPDFALKYELDPALEVWEVIRSAIDDPFPSSKWEDFLASCPWFVEHSDFLIDELARYRETGQLAVATYGFRQDDLMSQDFDADKDPWILNSVFAPYTVRSEETHRAAAGYWLESFRRLALR